MLHDRDHPPSSDSRCRTDVAAAAYVDITNATDSDFEDSDLAP